MWSGSNAYFGGNTWAATCTFASSDGWGTHLLSLGMMMPTHWMRRKVASNISLQLA